MIGLMPLTTTAQMTDRVTSTVQAGRAALARTATVTPLARAVPVVAVAKGGVRAVNQGTGPADDSIGGIPRPVLIGGAAVVGLVAFVFVAKKLKRKRK